MGSDMRDEQNVPSREQMGQIQVTTTLHAIQHFSHFLIGAILEFNLKVHNVVKSSLRAL